MGYGYDTSQAYAAASKVAEPKTYPDQLIGLVDVSPLVNLLSELPYGTPVAVDCETTGLYPHEHDVIRGVSIAFRTSYEGEQGRLHSFFIPVGYPDRLDNLNEPDIRRVFHALKERKPRLIFHHGKFDFTFLRQLPTDTDASVFFAWPDPHDWWDTKVVAWLLDENMPTGLKEQAAHWWGEDQKDEQTKVKALIKERGGWDKLTPADTAQYAAKDAEQTLRLYEHQLERVDGHPSILGVVRPAIVRELAVQALLARIERTGILVDAPLIEKMRDEAAAACEEIEAHFLDVEFVAETLGLHEDFLNGTLSVFKKGVNINSPQQLARYLYDGLGLKCPRKTKSGGRSTDRATLELLPETPEMVMLLKHRRLKKALTGYLRPLLERIGHDGRVHPTFWSVGTVTGRFSCSGPNLQTIPRADTLKGVRDVFIAEDGFELWEYDLQAAEKRVLAGMSGEQLIIDVLEQGLDVHSMLAERVFGPDFTGLQRRSAKNIGYGFDYGLSSPTTAAKYIGGDNAVELASITLAELRAMYPAVVALMKRTERRFKKELFLPIHDTAWPGRFRRLATPAKVKPLSFTGLNAQIQGGIGELMKDVMLEVEEPLAFWGASICLQVHDSLVIELPEGTGPYVHGVLNGALERLNPFAMPMMFEAAPWGDHG